MRKALGLSWMGFFQEPSNVFAKSYNLFFKFIKLRYFSCNLLGALSLSILMSLPVAFPFKSSDIKAATGTGDPAKWKLTWG